MAPPLGTWLPRLLRLAAFTAVAADAACRAARVGRTTLGAAALETLAALPAADVATVRCGELQGTLLHEAVEGGDDGERRWGFAVFWPTLRVVRG